MILLYLASAAAWQTPAPKPEVAAKKTALSAAAIDNDLDVSGAPQAARAIETRLTVAVKIGSQGPFQFLMDSGADRSIIGEALALKLRLSSGGSARVHGVTGATDVETVFLDGLHVGDTVVPTVVAPSLPERFLGADGILGIDALADQRLALDFQHLTITIQDARKPVRVLDGEIVVTARRRHGQLIMTQVYLGDIPVAAVVDTGSQITVGNMVLLHRLYGRRQMPPPTSLDVTSVTGITATAQMYPIKPMTIGTVKLDPAMIAFADFPPFALFGLADRPALLLGADVLRSFGRVSLDFRARKVRFQLRELNRDQVGRN